MNSSATNSEIEQRNQLIDQFLAAANGEEVHLSDLAWFLRLDPFYLHCWMRKHQSRGWVNGQNPLCWTLRDASVPDQ